MKRHLLLFCAAVLCTSFAFADTNRQQCVDQALADLGVDFNLRSDPQLLREILQDDMFLDDLPSVQILLSGKLKHSESMAPMLMKIRSSILAKHPAVVDFLCKAHEQKLLGKVDLRRMLHHMFIFDDIIVGMANDWTLMSEIHSSFLERRISFGVRDSFVGSMIDIYEAGGGLFGSIKAKTMDSVFDMYERIRERGYITDDEIESRTTGLRLNIMEAYATDRLHGNRDNAYAGLVLATIPPQTLTVKGKERRIQYVYDQEWTSLYETWNLSFITGNLENLHLLYPKLLIPAVLDAEPNDYLFNRALALWTSLNFFLFAKLEQHPDVALPNADALATLWGEINYEYAQRYMERMSQQSWTAYFLLKKMQIDQAVEAGWNWATSFVASKE